MRGYDKVHKTQKLMSKNFRLNGVRFVMFMVLSALLALLSGGCMKNTLVKKSKQNTVYFNSFETPQDTLSWYWANNYHLINDAPPGGGKHSLKVKGGRVLPAASFISQPLRYGGYFTVSCWGKVIDIAGYLQLATISDHDLDGAIQLHILDPEWKYIESTDTLFCPPNRSLMLTLQPGLMAEGSLAIDMIRVKKVGSAITKPRKQDKQFVRTGERRR